MEHPPLYPRLEVVSNPYKYTIATKELCHGTTLPSVQQKNIYKRQQRKLGKMQVGIYFNSESLQHFTDLTKNSKHNQWSEEKVQVYNITTI